MTQGISFHYSLWWLQALEEDKTCLMQFFFFFLLWKQESQCNPSKIVCLSLAQVEEPSNKEAPRITASFQQTPNATGTYFESCRVEGRVLASLYPKVVVRTGAAFMPLGECVRFLFYLDHCQ